jgi:hypothetical protein
MASAKKIDQVEPAQPSHAVEVPLTSVPDNDGTPDHASWTCATVALLRRLVAQQEGELERLREQLCAAEYRLAAGCN